MGSHFQLSHWNGVAHFRIFGVRKVFIFTVSKRTIMFVLKVKSKVFFIKKMGQFIFTLGTRGFFLSCDEELRRSKAEDTSGKAARKNTDGLFIGLIR